MPIDLDPFLVALYPLMDDRSQPHAARVKPVRPGPRPTVADRAVVTWALCAQGWERSERAVVRDARAPWWADFPRGLSPRAYTRRGRDWAGVRVALAPLVARELRATGAADEGSDPGAVPLLRRWRG